MAIERIKRGETTQIWHPDLVNLYGCQIGEHCSIGAFVEIGKGCIIGDHCRIQAFVYIPPGVTVGNHVFIGPGVKFTNDKRPPSHGQYWGEIVVEDEVSIGAGAIILPGITLGKGSVIGAGSVVTKSVNPGEEVYGNPAAPSGNVSYRLTAVPSGSTGILSPLLSNRPDKSRSMLHQETESGRESD